MAENVLADGGEVGFEHPGGYAEYFLTEADRVQPLPADYPLDKAALVEPLAVAVRALHRLAPESHDSALLFGDGPLGLLALMLLRQAGIANVVVVGGRPGRLATALALGAVRTVNYHEAGDDLSSAIAASLAGPLPQCRRSQWIAGCPGGSHRARRPLRQDPGRRRLQHGARRFHLE